jgi:hypothetical protein
MPQRLFRKQTIAAGLLVASSLVTSTAVAADKSPRAHHHERLNIPPIDELEILDPQVDPEGKPRALVQMGNNGFPQVDIPAKVIVHRYYYSGDRDFQGPMLQGGPTMLAVNDPTTGEQVYAETQLPPGAPRIKYRQDRIVYDYRDRSIIVCFGKPGLLGLGKIGKPSVTIVHHSAIVKNATKHAEQHRSYSSDLWSKTGISECTTSTVDSAKKLVENSTGAIKTVGTTALAPVKAVWQATPLSGLTTSQVKQPAFDEAGSR